MPGNQVLNDVRIFLSEKAVSLKYQGLDIPLPTISRRLMFFEEDLGKN